MSRTVKGNRAVQSLVILFITAMVTFNLRIMYQDSRANLGRSGKS